MGLMAMEPVLAGCAGLFRTERATERPAAAIEADQDPGRIWREGLAFARWSPSPHNIQPWRISVKSPLEAELFCDPGSLLRTTDASSAFTLVGLAIFVEYLAVALRPEGYALRTTFERQPLDYSTGKLQRVANLYLESCDPGPTAERDLLLVRRTSRLPYDGTPVGEADLQAMSALASASGQQMIWSSDDRFVRRVLELNRDTLFADLDNNAARNELRPWIRITDEEARDAQTGLSARCLGFPGWLLKSFFDQHQRWVRGWKRDLCGDMLVGSMHGTRTVAWWSGPFATPDDWLACGTLLARTWLEATRRGLVLHPFGSVITNPWAHGKFRDQVGASEGPEYIWLLVRLGRSAPAPRSYRLDEDRLFVSARDTGDVS
jgi:hypothetical protein